MGIIFGNPFSVLEPKLEALIMKMTSENSGWGYDRIVVALANLGYIVSDQTIGNFLRRYGIALAPKRSPRRHGRSSFSSIWPYLSGIEFFTVEVLTSGGLAASPDRFLILSLRLLYAIGHTLANE
jgi:putative transposase